MALCPVCKVDMWMDRDTQGRPVMACRNPQCPRYRPMIQSSRKADELAAKAAADQARE